MSRNRNTYKNTPRNIYTRLAALAAPSAPCFIRPRGVCKSQNEPMMQPKYATSNATSNPCNLQMQPTDATSKSPNATPEPELRYSRVCAVYRIVLSFLCMLMCIIRIYVYM